MLPLFPQDWGRVLLPQVPVLESIVRISVVYLVLFTLLRVILKCESSGPAISDLLVLVLLADAVQNGMAGVSISVTDALVLAATLIAWDWLINYIAFHSPWFYRLMHPRPLAIVLDGQIIRHNARRELITMEDIHEELRMQGMESLDEVAEAYVQSNGQISIMPKSKREGASDGNRHRDQHRGV